MNSCDWTDCSLEVGLFDGAPSTLLSAEGRKNIPGDKYRFINLCPNHFEPWHGKPRANEDAMDQSDVLAIGGSRRSRRYLLRVS
jgi:hypothetical protein